MKKLFTLVAFLTCFLGASAVTVVDQEVDFSKYSDISEFQFFSWRGSESAMARLSIQNGCLHFESTEATDPSWDCQFFPIGGVDAEIDVTYTLHFKIRGDHEGNVSMLGFGQTPYGQFPITTEWVEGTVDYTATNNDGNILMQCGDWIGSWDIAYLKITHEEKEQKPVQWANILVNGDASAPWANPDAQSINNAYSGEGAEAVCAYSKEFGFNENNPHACFMEDGVFVSHAKTVDPVLVWDSDGEQWGQQHSAGDPMPDNTWQNQFWINFPRPMKDGEQVKVSFRYKASKNGLRVTTQDHRAPGDYLGGGSVGELTFDTEWKEFDKTYSAAAGAQSIAFNFGENNQYLEDLDFYFDDLNVSLMVLDEGYFVASTNTETGLVEYNFDEAQELTYDEGEDAYVTTVGKAGDKDSWVNQVMISTVRGNDKGFKAGTLKPSEKIANDEWISYAEGANAKIDLPAAGVWTIAIAPGDGLMRFTQVEGDEIVEKEPLEEIPNPTEVVVKGLERDFTAAEQPADEEAGIAAGTGQAWDNQFFIVANRTLAKGEVTIIKFKYKSSIDAHTTTQLHGDPGAYLHWDAIGNVDFTTEWQDFEYTLTIPAEADGMKSIAFNMAEIKEACNYYIKDVVWMTEDMFETLINTEGAENFYVKEGANTNPYVFGTKVDVVKGDVNNDKEVDVSDIAAILTVMSGDTSNSSLEDANVNGDHDPITGEPKVDVADISAVLTIMAGGEVTGE